MKEHEGKSALCSNGLARHEPRNPSITFKLYNPARTKYTCKAIQYTHTNTQTRTHTFTYTHTCTHSHTLRDSLHARVAHSRHSVFPVPVGLSSSAFLPFKGNTGQNQHAVQYGTPTVGGQSELSAPKKGQFFPVSFKFAGELSSVPKGIRH